MMFGCVGAGELGGVEEGMSLKSG